jgi:hypothetical protein
MSGLEKLIALMIDASGDPGGARVILGDCCIAVPELEASTSARRYVLLCAIGVASGVMSVKGARGMGVSVSSSDCNIGSGRGVSSTSESFRLKSCPPSIPSSSSLRAPSPPSAFSFIQRNSQISNIHQSLHWFHMHRHNFSRVCPIEKSGYFSNVGLCGLRVLLV